MPLNQVRPFRPDADVLPLVRLLAEVEAVDRSGEALMEAELRIHLDAPQHDPETDRWVVEHPDGASLIAQAALYLPSDADDRRVADGGGAECSPRMAAAGARQRPVRADRGLPPKS